MHKSIFTTLVCLYQEQTPMRTNVIGAYTRILLSGMLGNSKLVICWPTALKVGTGFPIQMHVFLFPLWRFMMQNRNLVKAAVGANPNRISPNHTCQYSLLTLTCNISPSHFSLHTTFNIMPQIMTQTFMYFFQQTFTLTTKQLYDTSIYHLKLKIKVFQTMNSNSSWRCSGSWPAR